MRSEWFDWDEENIRHIARHGLLPEEVEESLFNDPTDAAEREHRFEQRFHQIGMTNQGRCLAVVTTWRRGKIRVVTAFPATRAELMFYLRERGLR